MSGLYWLLIGMGIVVAGIIFLWYLALNIGNKQTEEYNKHFTGVLK
jgi:hypothetical protein